MPFDELKQRHAGVWSSGPYQGITETITDIHRVVIERLDPQPGERLLDLACGTGAAAELAAERGVEVVGVDGDDFELEFDRAESVLESDSGESVWQLFSTEYGPTKVLAESLDDGKREELHCGFVELHEQSRTNGGIAFSRTYLLTLGTRK